jgi:hypothetical protein
MGDFNVEKEFGQIRRQLRLLAFTAAFMASALVWVAVHVNSRLDPEAISAGQILQKPEIRESPQRPEPSPKIPVILVKPAWNSEGVMLGWRVIPREASPLSACQLPPKASRLRTSFAVIRV